MMLAEDKGEALAGHPALLRDLIHDAVLQNPTKNAVVCMHQDKTALPGARAHHERGCGWSFEQLWKISGSLATELTSRRLSEKASIATFTYNCAEWAVFFWAAARMGVPFVPLDVRGVSRTSDVKHYLEIVKPEVLVVDNAKMAAALESEHSELLDRVQLKVFLRSDPETAAKLDSRWTAGSEFFVSLADETSAKPDYQHPQTSLDDTALVIFTSGTTSAPKACPHSNKNLWAVTSLYTVAAPLDSSRTYLQHLPNSHIMACANQINVWTSGVTVVFPSYAFEAGATLNALEIYQCTDMGAVPSMVSALLAHPQYQASRVSSLKYIKLGGTVITPQTLQHAQSDEGLGVKGTVLGYGMSEGTPTIGYRAGESVVSDGRFVSVGRAMPGVWIKITDKAGKIVERGEVGEMHISGTLIIKNYIDCESESFQSDAENNHWLVTGDEARMDEAGYIFVLGRYKDIIIRGGENISPAVIESALGTFPGITAQVVAKIDEIAGEVPVAIVQSRGDWSAANLSDRVRDSCGSTHVPASILTLEDIGLDSFPLTTTGKVKKAELRRLVEEQGSEDEESLDFDQERIEAQSSVEDKLASIWARVLGQSKDTIPRDRQMADMVDSIGLMRIRHGIQKAFSKTISIEDLMKPGGIRYQAEKIENASATKSQTFQRTQREGPPTMEDMSHTCGEPGMANATIEAATALLKDFGLNWDDHVEDVLPLTDWGSELLLRRRLQSWNHRHCYCAAPGTSLNDLRAALESALGQHPMLRTMGMAMKDSTNCHVVIRPGPEWYDHCFTVLQEISSADDLKGVAFDDPTLDYAAAPGPLFRIMLVPVKDKSTTGFIYQINHSIFDGLSIPGFIEDIDQFLSSKTAKPAPRLHYKFYADLYHTHYNSRVAHRGVKALSAKYAGLAKRQAALWPPQRSPEWFKGSDAGWTPSDHSQGQDFTRRSPIDPPGERKGVFGVTHVERLPHLGEMKSQHGIEPVIIFKAALALLNITQTGQDHALFANYQAARHWPFVTEFEQSYLPDAMDVSGPTFEVVVNTVHVDTKENTVGELLTRVADDQAFLTTWAHTPMKALHRSMSAADAATHTQVIRRQIFNWLPGLRSSQAQGYANLRRVQTLSRSDVGLLWNCGLLDADTFSMNASYDDAQLGAAEVEGLVEGYFAIARWISDPSNFGGGVMGWQGRG